MYDQSWNTDDVKHADHFNKPMTEIQSYMN